MPTVYVYRCVFQFFMPILLVVEPSFIVSDWLYVWIILAILLISIIMPYACMIITRQTLKSGSYSHLLALALAGLIGYGLPSLLAAAASPLWAEQHSPAADILIFFLVFAAQAVLGAVILKRFLKAAIPMPKILRACLLGFPISLAIIGIVLGLPFLLFILLTGLLDMSGPGYQWVLYLEVIVILLFGTAAGALTGVFSNMLAGLRTHMRFMVISCGLGGLFASLCAVAVPLYMSGLSFYHTWTIVSLFLGGSLGFGFGLSTWKTR